MQLKHLMLPGGIQWRGRITLVMYTTTGSIFKMVAVELVLLPKTAGSHGDRVMTITSHMAAMHIATDTMTTFIHILIIMIHTVVTTPNGTMVTLTSAVNQTVTQDPEGDQVFVIGDRGIDMTDPSQVRIHNPLLGINSLQSINIFLWISLHPGINILQWINPLLVLLPPEINQFQNNILPGISFLTGISPHQRMNISPQINHL